MAASGDRTVTSGCCAEGWHHFAGEEFHRPADLVVLQPANPHL
jgi:hypothetical protein